MAYAIELFFDETSSELLTKSWSALCVQGTGAYLVESGSRPHLTLAIFDKIDCDRMGEWLGQLSQQFEPFNLTFASVGTFLTDEGTVFLAPIVTEHLLRLHRKIHELTSSCEQEKWIHYLPGQWVPHCTMATQNTSEQGIRAIAELKQTFRPLQVTAETMGLVEFRPVRHHGEYPFKRRAT